MSVSIFRKLKDTVGDYLSLRSIEKHRSRLGWRQAYRYSNYLDHCRQGFTERVESLPEVQKAVQDFQAKNVASFWTQENQQLAQSIFRKIQDEERAGLEIWNERGQYVKEIYTTFPEIEQLFKRSLESFLKEIFKANFKIFYGMLYKSERRRGDPAGSELWHADGGPGTCIIVMFYLKDVEKEDGALECLPWDYSLATYRGERAVFRKSLEQVAKNKKELSREEVRKIKCDYFEEVIGRFYGKFVEQPTGPAGLVAAFGNNILHKGGYPAAGRARYVCLFHCYPADQPTPFERYRKHGIKKVESYPKDPAADF